MDATEEWHLVMERGRKWRLLFFKVSLIVVFWARYYFVVGGGPMQCLAVSLASTH